MNTSYNLTEYEVKVLRAVAGHHEPDLISGAALWVAAEALYEAGLLDFDVCAPGRQEYILTADGRAALRLAEASTNG
jgi:hypothetical protein